MVAELVSIAHFSEYGHYVWLLVIIRSLLHRVRSLPMWVPHVSELKWATDTSSVITSAFYSLYDVAPPRVTFAPRSLLIQGSPRGDLSYCDGFIGKKVETSAATSLWCTLNRFINDRVDYWTKPSMAEPLRGVKLTHTTRSTSFATTLSIKNKHPRVIVVTSMIVDGLDMHFHPGCRYGPFKTITLVSRQCFRQGNDRRSSSLLSYWVNLLLCFLCV